MMDGDMLFQRFDFLRQDEIRECVCKVSVRLGGTYAIEAGSMSFNNSSKEDSADEFCKQGKASK
jgi:hypothetical protein